MITRVDMNVSARCCRIGAGLLCLALLGGCSALRSVTTTPSAPDFYALDNALQPAATLRAVLPATAPTLLVSVTRAVAGFDSPRMIYLRQPHKLEHFARSEWIDTPARMLSPLVVAAVESSGAFRAVMQAPSSASGDLRLDTEVMQLQQEFTAQPSRVRFALRANLVDDATRRVIASREFTAVANAGSEDPYGGVVAANQAVRSVLEELAAFCASAAARWRPKEPPSAEAGRP